MLSAVLTATMLAGCGDSVETDGGGMSGEPEADHEVEELLVCVKHTYYDYLGADVLMFLDRV